MTSTAPSRAGALLQRATFLSASALLALAVAGCGSSSKSTSTPAAPAAAETTAASSTPAATTTTPAASESSTTSSSSSGGAEAIALAADPGGQLKFDKTSIEAKAGSVTLNFANDSPVGHNVTVASSSGETVGESPTFTGGSKALKLTLKPGTYKFYCSVPGHRQAGMEGTLTVK